MTFKIRDVAFLLLLLVIATYLPTLNHPFHFDDTHSIADNPAVHGLESLRKIWTDAKTSSVLPDNRIYRPLTFTVYAFCWAWGHGETWAFHVVKLFFHVGVCLAIFLIWRRLWSIGGWFPKNTLRIRNLLGPPYEVAFTPDLTALFLASAFAIHPAVSECVTYISTNTSLQCSFFYLYAFLCFLVYRESKKTILLATSLVLYAASVLSKEEGITLPAVVFLTEFMQAGGSFRERTIRSLKALLPYAVVMGLLAKLLYEMRIPTLARSRGFETPWTYFMTQWRAWFWYMKIWFIPNDLNADNVGFGFSKSLREWKVIAAALFHIVLLSGAWVWRKRFPAILWGLLWFYITISPASSVVPLAEPVNEHRMYLAYAGWIGSVATLLLIGASRISELSVNKERTALLLTVLLTLLTGAGWTLAQQRNEVWKSSQNLWEDNLKKNPESGRAANNLALIYMGRGEYEQAITLLKRCAELWPNYPYCKINQGVSLQALSRFQDAEDAFAQAIFLDPNLYQSHYFMGEFYLKRGKLALAQYEFERTDTLTGGTSIGAKSKIAKIEIGKGNISAAIQRYREILTIDPKNEEALSQIKTLTAETP